MNSALVQQLFQVVWIGIALYGNDGFTQLALLKCSSTPVHTDPTATPYRTGLFTVRSVMTVRNWGMPLTLGGIHCSGVQEASWEEWFRVVTEKCRTDVDMTNICVSPNPVFGVCDITRDFGFAVWLHLFRVTGRCDSRGAWKQIMSLAVWRWCPSYKNWVILLSLKVYRNEI